MVQFPTDQVDNAWFSRLVRLTVLFGNLVAIIVQDDVDSLEPADFSLNIPQSGRPAA